MAKLIARVDAARCGAGLSSAVRIWVLQHFRRGSRAGGRAGSILESAEPGIDGTSANRGGG
jgi:hypothetical protein